jgi:hypothetical protein
MSTASAPPSPSALESAVTAPPKMLNLGTILSKGLDSISTFAFEENNDEEGRPFSISADLIVTGRTCVIGSSGSGKSYTVGVICEELCKSKVPFVIVDIEGEYSGLKEKYEAIWVGDDDESDLKWSKKVDLKLLAKYAPDCPPIILDVSEAYRPKEKVNEFLIAIYREISKRRTPYLVILEEADRFSPQTGGERLQVVDEIARRGRKRGLGLMLCTQRPSLVDKNILSQCSNQLIGKLVIKNDLRAVDQFFSGYDPSDELTSLKPGEFFALGGLVSEPEKVKMRPRETHHGGKTPKLNFTTMQASVGKILESIESGAPPVTASLTLESSSTVSPELENQPLREEEQPGKRGNDDEHLEPLVPFPRSSIHEGTMNNEQQLQQRYEIEQRTSALGQISERESIESQNLERDENSQTLSLEERFDWLTAGQRSPSAILGLAPMIEAESVPRLVKLERSYKLFGHKENVTQVGLAFRPLVEVGVRMRRGHLKKKFETKYFFLDGVSGRLVFATDRLGFRSGLERLIGLQEAQVEVLKVLRPDRDMTIIEVASLIKRPEDETRRLIKGLESKRLVRSTRVGRYNMYRTLVDLPKIDLVTEPLTKLNELNLSDGFKLAKLRLKEDEVREVVKGLWEGADVESFRQIYYPVYLAELLLNDRKRYVWIDGRTGKEIEM